MASESEIEGDQSWQPSATNEESAEKGAADPRRLVSLESMDSNYVTAMSHFYRGEMARTLSWRHRLDPTTNWALVTSAAFISVAFSEESVSHLIFVPNFFLLHILLLIEARRYRFYDAWRARLRMIEAHFMVPVVLEDTKLLQGNWKTLLAEDLLIPSYKMGRLESIGRRMKRNYLWIFAVILMSWCAKVVLDPATSEESVRDWATFLNALAGSFRPRWIPISVFLLALVEVVVFSVWTLAIKEYSGDIGPRKKDARPWRV